MVFVELYLITICKMWAYTNIREKQPLKYEESGIKEMSYKLICAQAGNQQKVKCI